MQPGTHNLLPNSDIIGFLAYTHRRKIAVEVVLNAINNETYITEPEEVTRVFAAIKPLLMDEEDQGEELEQVIASVVNEVYSPVHRRTLRKIRTALLLWFISSTATILKHYLWYHSFL